MYRLVIKAKNKMFMVRGILVRSPLKIEKLSNKELKFYLSKVRMEGLREKDFYYEEISSNKQNTKNTISSINFDHNYNDDIDVEIEELNDHKTTLEKLLDSND